MPARTNWRPPSPWPGTPWRGGRGSRRTRRHTAERRRVVAPLVEAGILTEFTGFARNRAWQAIATLAALDAFGRWDGDSSLPLRRGYAEKAENAAKIFPEQRKHVCSPLGDDGFLVRRAFFFTVRQWDGEPENREPDKCSELAWCPLGALPAHMIAYCRTAMEHIAAGQPFSIYGW